MKRLLLKLMLWAGAFGGVFAASRFQHATPPAHRAEQPEMDSGPPAEALRKETARTQLKALFEEDQDITQQSTRVESMTPLQIQSCLDTLYDSMRLDLEAAGIGSLLMNAWIERDPLAAFHWCDAHHFEFAHQSTAKLFQRLAADDPAQAETLCAKLKTTALRKDALTGIAEASPPGNERATLDRLLAFGSAGEEAALDWCREVTAGPAGSTTRLVEIIKADKGARIKWRTQALHILASPLQNQSQLPGK
ncbi:MAG TPA: hypothetical protein VHM91_07720 [Verrucomicrobiales bacterium]|nr:hypothetical protein [Verrucomicrobiales bacterium]